MKKFISIACGLILVPAFVQGADDAAASELKTPKEKYSYSIGMSLGRNWKGQDLDVDLNLLTRAIQDTFAGKTLISETQAMENLRALQDDMRQKMMEKRKVLGEKNKTEGEAFLAKHKGEAGVVTTASGLQYKAIKEGTGESPKMTDNVTVNYKGTLIDGTEFDSSAKAGKPFTTGLNRVVKGWTEALQLMKPGAKYEIVLPPALGYGESGNKNIGPNSVLIFEIELLEVKPQVVAQPSSPPKPVTSDIIRVPSAEAMKKGEQIQVIKKEDAEKEIDPKDKEEIKKLTPPDKK